MQQEIINNELKKQREILKIILTSEEPVLEITKRMDFIISIIPEIKYMIGFDQKHPHHHLDVWDHTLLAISKSENDFEVRLALLLHDIGKPFSYQDDNDIRHFYGHCNVSSEMSRKILNRLDYNEEFINEICELIKYHDTPITKNQISNNKDFYLKLFQIQKYDALAHHPDKLQKRIKYLIKTKFKINEC